MVVAKVLFLFCFVGVCYCEKPSNFEGRIVGGHQVTIQRAPFMASLQINSNKGMMRHCCGGSIINKRFILSAAHCIKPKRKYRVSVGTDRKNSNDGQLYDVEKIIVHKRYNTVTKNFDICLIKLARDLKFSKKVACIKLADETVKFPNDAMLNVTGWGATGEKPLSIQQLLQVTVPFVNRKLCQSQYGDFKITDTMMCAGTKGKNACKGDSGGPLTIGSVQVGITSFGQSCKRGAAVYVKVSTLLPWITSELARLKPRL